MKDNILLIKNIESLGERYCEKHLDIWDKDELENNWWAALNFFFCHSFMRGRRDELSNEYQQFTISVLKDYFSIVSQPIDRSFEYLEDKKKFFGADIILKFKKEKNLARGNSIVHEDFEREISSVNPVIKTLLTKREIKVKWDDTTYWKEIYLGNDQDIMMVLDVLNFITLNKERMNIYSYLREKIIKSGIKAAYEELVKIYAVGDKIAAFTIRDIGLMNPEIDKDDFGFAFPVDTWVFNIANKIGCKTEDIEEVKECLLEKCRRYEVEPLKFAAGLWFLGFHSLDILLEDCLTKIEI